MNTIGIKIVENMTYEQFESFQYLLEFDFEYEDMEEAIKEKKIITLDIDDEEEDDRKEDFELLGVLLGDFDKDQLAYELYALDTEWEQKELSQLS